jgi:hypothetical protein
MAFRAAVFLLLMISMSSKCLLSLPEQKRYWRLDPVNIEGVTAQLFVY